MGGGVSSQKERDMKNRQTIIEKMLNIAQASHSVSNPSLDSNESDTSDDVVASPSMLFDMETKNEIYERFLRDTGIQRHSLTVNIIRSITPVMEIMGADDNILYYANKYVECLHRYDENFLEAFSYCADHNPMVIYEHQNKSMNDRLILHKLYLLRIERILSTSYEDGKEEKAQEIYNLVALSHLIMQVKPFFFEQMNLRQIKFLLHHTLITEDQLAPMICYLEARGQGLIKALENHKMKKKVIKFRTENDSPSRDNYRQLKKWFIIIQNLRKSLQKPLAELEKQIESGRNDEMKLDVGEDEPCMLINLLKKGYKYKEFGRSETRSAFNNFTKKSPSMPMKKATTSTIPKK